MSAGRSTPKFNLLATLYSKSPTLQSAISDYFLVVIQLCDCMVKFAQKSTTMQFASAIVDTDLKRLEGDLGHWANIIKNDASMLSAITIREESKEMEAYRALTRKNVTSMSLQQKAKRRLQILDFCSKYDYQTTWKQLQKSGSCILLEACLGYQDWKQQQGPRTLMYTGKLGSGKLVLLANMVDDIHLHAQAQKITVAYFFCRHDIVESLQARTILGCLARQWLQGLPEIRTIEGTITANIWDMDDICNVLLDSLPSSSQAYFILDGVDELDRSEKECLISHLSLLMENFTNIRLCLSYRNDMTSPKFCDAATVSIPDTNPDIETFIGHELEKRCISGDLALGDESLIVDIVEALTSGSNGMFLWVYLQIECLCTMQTDEQIRLALKNLSKGLSQTYTRILQKSSRDFGVIYQRQILDFVISAFRPLTTDELREALSVKSGDTKLMPERMANNIRTTLACCGPLIMVDEEDHTVRLVHQSVKQFLLTECMDADGNPFYTRKGACEHITDALDLSELGCIRKEGYEVQNVSDSTHSTRLRSIQHSQY